MTDKTNAATERAARDRYLRRANRRLRWKKGSYKLIEFAAYRYRASTRRDVVVRLLQQREWRLALTVAAMPHGWSIKNEEARRAGRVGARRAGRVDV